jgi:hypothetical protein
MSRIKRSLLRPRPQELGKIKIGGKGAEREKKGGGTFQIPQKYDHFVVTTRVRGPDGNFVKDEAIHSNPLVGEKPVVLDAVLMYPDVEDNFSSAMVQYNGKKRIIECDGEEMHDLIKGDCQACPRSLGGTCACKPYSRLHVQLMASPYTAGYHVYRTTGWESTNNIQTALEEIYAMFGTLFRAPVRLMLYPSEDTYEEKGVTKTSQSYKVGLVLAMGMDEVSRLMVDAARQLGETRRELRMLAGEVVADLDQRDRDEDPDIADDFFPAEEATVGSKMEDALRAAGKADAEAKADGEKAEPPVVDGDYEVEASPGMLSQVESLMQKAKEAGVLTEQLKAKAEVALLRKDEGKVKAALSELSLALIQRRAEASDSAQGSLLDEGK